MFVTGSIPPPGPLAYSGEVAVPFLTRTFNPTTSNNQFPVPTIWINTETSSAFILVSKALGVAIWLALGGPPGVLDTITTPDGTVVVPFANNIDFLNGTGMNITGSGSNITFNATGGGITWNLVTGTSQAISPNNGYVADNGGGVTLSLPTVCPFGSVIGVTGIMSAGWTITQSAGQMIQIGDVATTIGVGGSLASTQIGDSVTMVCTTANTNFLVFSSMGNITRV